MTNITFSVDHKLHRISIKVLTEELGEDFIIYDNKFSTEEDLKYYKFNNNRIREIH